MSVSEALSLHNGMSSDAVREVRGNMRSRDIRQVVPSSHMRGDDRIIIGLIVAAVIFLGSIIMWAVGASTGVVGLELVGKIFFGLSIAAIGVALIILLGIGGCLLKRAS